MTVFSEVLRDDLVVKDRREVRVRIVNGGLTGYGRVMVSVAAAVPGCGPLHVRAVEGSYVVALGRQDALTGHSPFDDRYIVKTNDVDLMRFWLGPPELDAILTTYDRRSNTSFALELDAGAAVLTAEFTEHRNAWESLMLSQTGLLANEAMVGVERLDEATTAAAWIGNRGERLVTAWRERAIALGGGAVGDVWTGTDAFSLAVPRGRHPIRIDFPYAVAWSSRQSVRTRVWCPRSEPGAAVAALSQPDLPRAQWPRLAKLDGHEISIGSLGGPMAVTDRPPPVDALDARAIAADIDWIVIDETSIAAGWESIVEKPAQLSAGIEIVALLADWLAPAQGAAGPYR